MVQRREDASFSLEPGETFRIFGESLGKDFDGHIAPERVIPGAVDFPHAATADLFQDLVMRKLPTREARR